MKIPRWQEHLRSIVLKEQANRLAELVAYQIDVVQEAVDVVAHSESLRRLFSLLLVMGNHVNHGNPKGNALGFHISSLPSVSRESSIFILTKNAS